LNSLYPKKVRETRTVIWLKLRLTATWTIFLQTWWLTRASVVIT